MRIETFIGAAMAPYLPALARLRVAVFREWPYLYAGDTAEEERSLQSATTVASAALVVAFDGDEPVGCATCRRLEDAGESVLGAFRSAGLPPEGWCYFGESVLLKQFRGQGAGVAFFAHREEHARRLGCDRAAFCAIERAANDPRRPQDAPDLVPFWRHRSYAPHPTMTATMRWTEIGGATRADHILRFWTRTLA